MMSKREHKELAKELYMDGYRTDTIENGLDEIGVTGEEREDVINWVHLWERVETDLLLPDEDTFYTQLSLLLNASVKGCSSVHKDKDVLIIDLHNPTIPFHNTYTIPPDGLHRHYSSYGFVQVVLHDYRVYVTSRLLTLKGLNVLGNFSSENSYLKYVNC